MADTRTPQVHMCPRELKEAMRILSELREKAQRSVEYSHKNPIGNAEQLHAINNAVNACVDAVESFERPMREAFIKARYGE